MHKLTAMVFVGVVVASTASAQSLHLTPSSRYPQAMESVGVRLLGFSTEASSATVRMIGEEDSDYPLDGDFCRAIRPISVTVSLLNGAGFAVWDFSNRFDRRYILQCSVRATEMGTTADATLRSFGGEHRMTLNPAQVAAHARTSVDVAVYIYSRFTDGSTVSVAFPSWAQYPVVAKCRGVTPTSFDLEHERVGSSTQLLGTWEVTTTDPVECPVALDPSLAFEGSPATLSVVAATPFPALPVVGLWVLLLLLLGVGGVAAAARDLASHS